jgi:hypothetical protein
MKSVATIGLDIVKSIFQVHGVDAAGQFVVRQRLARRRVLAFFGTSLIWSAVGTGDLHHDKKLLIW